MPTETCVVIPCVVAISIAVVVNWDSYLVFMEMNDKLIDGQTNIHTKKKVPHIN